jgi:hypothetical protein
MTDPTIYVGGYIRTAPVLPIHPSCAILAAYLPGYVDVYIGGALQALATVTATDGATIGLSPALLWLDTASLFLGMSIAGQTQVMTPMGAITTISLNGVITTAYTLSYYATNLLLVTFSPGLEAGQMIIAAGTVYLGGVIEVMTLNPVGPTWTTGTDVPSTTTMPVGSLYSCTIVDTPLWVFDGTAWHAVSIITP